MHWRITLEAIDPIGDGYRKEFMIEKDLDGLADGKLGCSIEDGKAIMKEVQRALPTCSHRIESIVIRALQATISRA